MSFLTFILIVGVLVLSAAIFMSLKRQTGRGGNAGGPSTGKSKTSSISKAKPANPYRAVSIQAGLIRCEAVEVVEGKRYLVEENDVPQLPLTSCDAEKCECKYLHHEDRRDGDDRRSIGGSLGNIHIQTGQEERRNKRGRRKTDSE